METKNSKLTINAAIEMSGFSNNYIRKAIASGALKTHKELVPGTNNNWRNVIDNWDEWRASTKQRTTREDGRNKFVVYMNADEVAELEKLVESHPFLATLKRANIKAEVTEEE